MGESGGKGRKKTERERTKVGGKRKVEKNCGKKEMVKENKEIKILIKNNNNTNINLKKKMF